MHWTALGLRLAAVPLLLAGATTVPRRAPPVQADYDALAHDLGFRYAILDNHPEHCPAGTPSCFLATLTFTMPATLPAGIEASDFAIYFSFVRRLPLVESDVFAGELINGDLHRLTLKPGAALVPGQSYTVALWGEGAQHSAAFAMPNLYLVATGIEARVIEASRPAIDAETGREVLPFLDPMTDEARLATGGGNDLTVWQTPERAFETFAARGAAITPEIAILPTPTKAELLPGATIDLAGGVAVHLHGVEHAGVRAALDALARAGVPLDGAVPLAIHVDAESGIAAGGYRLSATDGRITIHASDAAGASNALHSLVQQALFDQRRLRPLSVEDAPRYGFRGLHLDLARNFHSKREVLKLIEAMAAFKLNRLHLHLADDEGWRIEIKALPELTEIGSRRCHDPSETRCLLPELGAGPDGTGPVNGFLSQADYIEIVRAAAAHHIEVIPSLDMPGHSRAAIRSMEARYRRLVAAGHPKAAEAYRLVEPADTTRYRSIQNYDDNTLNVCIEQTYRFLHTAVDEIAAMHREAGAPLRTFHIGADETAGAWSSSPACKALMAKTGRDARALDAAFVERVAAELAAKGIRTAGWSDGLSHTDAAKMPASVQSNIWGPLFAGGVAEAHEQANRSWDVVLSIPDLGYFDMPYVPHPLEGGYDWATRSVDTFQVFGFMTGDLPANAALIRDIHAQPRTIDDTLPLVRGGYAGLQAQLWSETTRTDAGVDYQLFPRLIALAERAWHRPEWEPDYQAGRAYEYGDAAVDRAAILADWRRFAGSMPVQLALLDRLGIAYRVTPPGARIAAGRLEANAEYPGTAIEYRTPGGAWQRYDGPISVTGPVELRTRSADGKRASRIVEVR